MPPARPAELILASAGDQSGGAVLPPPAPNRGPARARIAQRGLLPKVITSGVDTAPTGALALAEASPAQNYDDSELLARAAELTAPLPPMPTPNAAAPTAATPDARRSVTATGRRGRGAYGRAGGP